MGFLKHLRSKSRLKPEAQPEAQIYVGNVRKVYSGRPTAAGRLPPHVLDLLFSFVCPHTLDESYLSSEDSMFSDDCMLCQMRDLAHCGQMNRAWASAMEKRLYHSVRLDTVHYCQLEIQLSEKRKRHKKFDRNGEPKDPTQQRLKMFYETVRNNNFLASKVNFLKMPYMTRESCKADLARTVSVLPNLRYVDLPDGFFSGDGTTQILRTELQGRCPEIRKMKYLAGAESSFTALAQGRMWQNLESLELVNLQIDADILLYVLSSFPALRSLSLGGDGMSCLTDEVLIPNNNPHLPSFPPLTRLVLKDAHGITATGLVEYLSRPETRESLKSLELHTTGVAAHELHAVLACATRLTHLSYYEVVIKAFPIAHPPYLASNSLRTFAFELLPEQYTGKNPVSETYYNYLGSSLLAGALPLLSECYAYSPSLPDLLFSPVPPPFGAPGGGNGNSMAGGPLSPPPAFDPTAQALHNRFSMMSVASNKTSSTGYLSNGPLSPATYPGIGHHQKRVVPTGLRSPLALYTKSPAAPELEWSLTTIDPPSERNGRRGSASATRPLSLVMNAGRGGKMVGDGFGGYLAVPPEEALADGGHGGGYGGHGGGVAGGGLLSPAKSSFGHARKASRVGQGMGEWMG